MRLALCAILCILLSGCATRPSRCYIVISQGAIAAELCEQQNKVTLLGEPNVQPEDIPAYIKGILILEDIAYTNEAEPGFEPELPTTIE